MQRLKIKEIFSGSGKHGDKTGSSLVGCYFTQEGGVKVNFPVSDGKEPATGSLGKDYSRYSQQNAQKT